MKKSLLIIGGVVILGILVAVVWVLRPSPEASAPIEAIPLAASTQGPVSEEITPTEAIAYPAPTEAISAYPVPGETAVQTNTAYPAPEEAATETTTSDAVIFTIVQAESEARFTLTELLNGNPKTVVGTTDQVAGEIAIDFANPTNSQLGIIQVNARTITTDSNNRNRMIQNEILDTGPYEFITFTATALTGLPATIAVGETITFQITGDLTIRDITQQVTFEATATVISLERLEGLASVTITREAYSLTIPSVPQVANISEEVLVELEFVAVPTE